MAPEQVNLTEHIRRTFFDLAKIAASVRSGLRFVLRQIIERPASPLAVVEGLDARTFDNHVRHIFTHGEPP